MGFLKNMLNTVRDNLRVNEPDAWTRDAEKGYEKFFAESDKYINRNPVGKRYYEGQLLEGQIPVFKEKFVENASDYYNAAPSGAFVSSGPSEEEERQQAADDFIRRQAEEDAERDKRRQEYDDLLLFNIVMSEQDPEWNDN